MPVRYPYSYNNSMFLVELGCALPICALAYAFVRRFFSFTALCAVTAAVAYILYYYAMEPLDASLCFLACAAIITLPRMINRYVNKGKEKEKQISRMSMQILALPVAAVSVIHDALPRSNRKHCLEK
jgi:hypothetical protein